MRTIKGFKIGIRLVRFPKWIIRKTRLSTRLSTRCRRLDQPERTNMKKPMAKIINWGRRITNRAKFLCQSKSGPGYITLGKKQPPPPPVPKGHLAVYVGRKDGELHRVLVPVIYFNHPLFGKLLRETEEEYGFNHQGGIMIPCGVSEFEKVQTRIESGSGDRKMSFRRFY